MVYLVVGASGQQGGAVARALLAQGAQVRALTRDPKKAEALKKQGAEVAIGDFDTPDSLRKALQGATGAFLVTTWFEEGPDRETEQGNAFLSIAEEACLPHLVYSSVGGADVAPSVPHFHSKWKVEQEIRASSLPWTILRPVWFMENFGRDWFLPALQEGGLAMPLPAETQLAMIALKDIGKAGATALLNPEKFAGRTLELSAEEWAVGDIAEAISAAVGKTITYEQLADEAAAAALGEEMLAMYHWFEEVGFSLDPLLSEQLGFELTGFQEYLATAPWT